MSRAHHASLVRFRPDPEDPSRDYGIPLESAFDLFRRGVIARDEDTDAFVPVPGQVSANHSWDFRSEYGVPVRRGRSSLGYVL